MTSWNSTWKLNSLHTMASDPPAITTQVTSYPFGASSPPGLDFFTPLFCACARATKCTFGQVHQGEQSLQPSHHGHHALRLRSPNPSCSAISSTKSPRRPRIAPTQPALVPPLRRQRRGCFTFLIFSQCSNNATNTSNMRFLSSLFVSMYLLYIFLTLHIFLLWPHFGFDVLFDFHVLLFALREAFKL